MWSPILRVRVDEIRAKGIARKRGKQGRAQECVLCGLPQASDEKFGFHCASPMRKRKMDLFYSLVVDYENQEGYYSTPGIIIHRGQFFLDMWHFMGHCPDKNTRKRS